MQERKHISVFAISTKLNGQKVYVDAVKSVSFSIDCYTWRVANHLHHRMELFQRLRNDDVEIALLARPDRWDTERHLTAAEDWKEVTREVP